MSPSAIRCLRGIGLASSLALSVVPELPVAAARADTLTNAVAQPAFEARRDASGLTRRLGAQVPLAARFRASDGRDVTLGDVLHDEPGLLVLAYNRCTMLCSLVLRRMAELVPQLGLAPGDQFTLLTVSIDPQDTVLEAARMRDALLEHAGMTGQRQRWEFLVGQRDDIDQLADAVGFGYRWDPSTEQFDHPAVLITLAPGGRVSGYFDALQPSPTALAAALQRPTPTLTAATTVEDLILRCFRLDGVQSRHGALIAWLLRAGAASVALALAALIWRLGRGHWGVQP